MTREAEIIAKLRAGKVMGRVGNCPVSSLTSELRKTQRQIEGKTVIARRKGRVIGECGVCSLTLASFDRDLCPRCGEPIEGREKSGEKKEAQGA